MACTRFFLCGARTVRSGYRWPEVKRFFQKNFNSNPQWLKMLLGLQDLRQTRASTRVRTSEHLSSLVTCSGSIMQACWIEISTCLPDRPNSCSDPDRTRKQHIDYSYPILPLRCAIASWDSILVSKIYKLGSKWETISPGRFTSSCAWLDSLFKFALVLQKNRNAIMSSPFPQPGVFCVRVWLTLPLDWTSFPIRFFEWTLKLSFYLLRFSSNKRCSLRTLNAWHQASKTQWNTFKKKHFGLTPSSIDPRPERLGWVAISWKLRLIRAGTDDVSSRWSPGFEQATFCSESAAPTTCTNTTGPTQALWRSAGSLGGNYTCSSRP